MKTFKTNSVSALLIFFVLATTLSAQKWEKKTSPLFTPWAEEVTPEFNLNEYPRPLMSRENWMNLNGLWEFSEALEGEIPPFGKNLKEQILVPYPWESALSGIRKQLISNRAWYKRNFEIPPAWKGKNINLNFGAVDWQTTVYINRRCVGTHKGGYDEFSFDITQYLNKKGKQEIVVEVWDPSDTKAIAYGKQNRERFSDPQKYAYSPSSGIWQTVWLEPVSNVSIKDLHIQPDLNSGTVNCEVFTTTLYEKSRIKVLFEGKEIGSGIPNSPFQFAIENVVAWSPENPYLYDIKLLLCDSTGNIVDEIGSYFGMRKIEIRKTGTIQKIYLNGKEYYQIGPLDQGFWPDGIYTAPTDEALRWDIANIKECGFNMIRKHIKIEPQRWYYWCDKLGVLVWQDMPSMFKTRNEDEKTQFETELKQMVRTHWNHPSIVNWVVFNEHWGLYDVERLTTDVMQLDPTRLVTGNSGIDARTPHVDYQVGHLIDNHSYRPPSVPFPTDKRAAVNGEYGAIGYLAEGHIWDIDGPWVHYNYEGKDASTAEYESFIKMILGFQKKGLCASVYTQWTDVENEMNGIYSYDRKLQKLDIERVRNANLSTQKVNK